MMVFTGLFPLILNNAIITTKSISSTNLKNNFSPVKYKMDKRSTEMLGWMKHKLESRLPGEVPIPQIYR